MKYKFTGESKTQFGITFKRIKNDKGEVGGWIEKESNLDMSGNAWVYGDAQVYGNARVYGDAQVYGDARVYGNAWVSFGILVEDIFKAFSAYISCSLNVYPNPVTRTYLLFKKVTKISPGVYASCYDNDFIYRDGEESSVSCPDMNRAVSCGSGIHVSTPHYWLAGDTLIAVEVHEDDIITCQEGKLRCGKVRVVGEIK
jgi:hypothetical protein